MSAPLLELGAFGEGGAQVAAVVLGVAFGWALERAGLGRARKLAGQFYGTDLTVLKVMFAALITAMLGVFWSSRAGLLDLSRVYVPETYLLPQLLGGLTFGAGFVVSGLCPGTSCVAAATGRGDGAAVMLGIFAGVSFAGWGLVPFGALYTAGARGAWTLPDLFGVSYGIAVGGVVALALGAFRAAAWWEARSR